MISKDDDEDDEDDEEHEQEDQIKLTTEEDYDIGHAIRTQVIPEAISWFTNENGDDEDYEFDEDDEDAEDDDEDDDDDEDEEENQRKEAKGETKMLEELPLGPTDRSRNASSHKESEDIEK